MSYQVPIAFALALLFCAGCVPFVDTYYEPEMVNNLKLWSRGCRSLGGPLRASEYETNAISVVIATSTYPDPVSRVATMTGEISLDIKKGANAELKDSYLRFDIANQPSIQVLIENIHRVSESAALSPHQLSGSVHATFTIPAITSDAFILTLPPMNLAGKAFSIPPIRYKKVSHPEIMPLNGC